MGNHISRLFGCAMMPVLFMGVIAGPSWGQSPGHVRGRLLVKFRANISPNSVRSVLNAFQAREADELPWIGVKIVSLPPNASETAFERAFRNRAEVEFAEVDRLVAPDGTTPNDPLYPSQWHLQKIAAPDAWSSTTGNGSITIAILDTGVDGTHPDLAAKMVPGWNIHDNSPDTGDVYGHGTMVAGTAAASGNNWTGVASIAWNCLIMPVRISDAKGYASYSDIARGLTWAADRGARVANISYMVTTSSTVTTAAKYFVDHGGVVSSSAGNYGKFDSSADNPYILTVSATDQNDALYSWSNTGNNIDLAAPGCMGSTTTRGGGYGSPCGTSFSAPIVAGVAALVLSVNPSLTPAQVTGILKQSADDLGPAGWDPAYGSGRVNAARAVQSAWGVAPAEPPTISITSPANGATVSGTVPVTCSASDKVGVVRVELYVDGALTSASTVAPFVMTWNTKRAKAGPHSLMERAYDAAGNVGTSPLVTVNR